MNVLVIGAAGNVGYRIVNQLANSSEHHPIAQVRHPEQAEQWKNKGIDTRLVDLEDTVDAIADGMKGVDAIIFSAGSGAKTGDDKTILIDLDGAVKTMEAAEKVGIKRYIMVSALNSENREKWHTIKPYFAAKYYADRILSESDLDYTILKPGVLTDDSGTGKITNEFVEGGEGSIPRDDVAAFAVACLSSRQSVHKAIDLVKGSQTIPEILQSL